MTTLSTLRATSGVLVLLALVACGSDSTAPAEPDVSGLYELISETSPGTCSPASAFDILQPTLGTLTTREVVRVTEQDGQITLTLEHVEGIDGRPVNVGDNQPILTSIAEDGSFHYERHLSGQFTLSARTFYNESTLTTAGHFDTGTDPVSLTLSGTSTQVYREDDPAGPVFATCTQMLTTSGARTGG